MRPKNLKPLKCGFFGLKFMYITQRPFEVKSVDDSGKFSGYGSVFGNVDSYGDRVLPGAFERSLKRFEKAGHLPSLLWAHQQNVLPPGGYTFMGEDSKGLFLEAQLDLDDDPFARTLHSKLKKKLIKGLSIGYQLSDPDAYDVVENGSVWELKNIDLMEVSLVNIPANGQAQVDNVKSMIAKGIKPTRRQYEKALRDLGFSVNEAKRVAANGISGFVTDEDYEIKQALEDLNKKFQSLKSA